MEMIDKIVLFGNPIVILACIIMVVWSIHDADYFLAIINGILILTFAIQWATAYKSNVE